MKRTITTAAAAALAVGLVTGTALSASATHAATADGNATVGCSVDWNAETLLDVDEADMPEQFRVHGANGAYEYSNSGYVKEVSPTILTSPKVGKFEIMHYILGDGHGGHTVNWRVFVGTDHPVASAVLTVDLPAVAGPYTTSDATAWGVNRYVPALGGTWTMPHTPADVTPTTVSLGDMPANSSTTIVFTAPLTAGTEHDSFVAKAHVSGTYSYGAGCEAPAPEPTVTPTPAPTTPVAAPTTPATPVATPTTPAAPISTPAPTPDVTLPAQPTPVRTVPAVPVVTAPARPVVAPAMVTRTFQVDRYLPKTAAQARVVRRLDDDGRLAFREDKALWGASRWQFVTVRVPAHATHAQVVKALNAKTSASVGDVRTSTRISSVTPGRAVVVAWELGRGATPKAAWGTSTRVNQTFFARS